MDNTTNKNAKRKSVLKWLLIIAVNVAIAVTVIIMSVTYSIKQNDGRYREKEDNFSFALDAMGQTAYLNLHTEQVFCDNWASYINFRSEDNGEESMTLSVVAKFVGNVNTDTSRVLVQVINYEKSDEGFYEGFYVEKPDSGAGIAGQAEDSEESVKQVHIDYDSSELVEAIGGALEESKTCERDSSHLHITRPFVNPADGETVIGFCHYIEAVDDYFDNDGVSKRFALVRLLKVDDFYGKWLPPSFNKAKLALVDKTGEFIVPFNDFNGNKVTVVEENNFFDYLVNKTNAGEAKVNSLRNDFDTKLSQDGVFSGNLRCSRDGKGGYYSYHRLQNNEEWMLVGFILKDDLNVISLDTTLAIIVIVGFIVLMCLDGAYIIVTNIIRLKKSMEEIQYANEAKTRFLSSMSHDIRTPMNAIIGMTTIAAKRIDDKQQVEECLRQIARASNHLLTLINDVLDISKVESGKLSLNPAVFSLAELMANIISISQPTIKEKQMEFEIHAHSIKHEYIFADELRINQILINLISNAIKYTPEKGKVLVGLEEQPSDKGQDMIRLIFTVSDTGIGISEDFMKNMYDTFARDIDSRINTIQGAGLGLAITKQMVDIMGGTIDAKSKVGVGTTFTVTLDLPIAEKVTDNLVLPPLEILVVDDDKLFLESAADTLRSLGLTAETVDNGADAVKMVEDKHVNSNDYQCVIVDWKMPDMDGLETIRQIRKKIGDEVSVIIISAYDWTEIEQEAIKAGANGFITKPLFRSTVYNKLNELLKFNEKENTVQEDEEEDLKGMNLLIAEDNDINWEIIQVMLEFHGITAERAENGQICVDKMNAAADGQYKAILMDIQMPVMNGKEATKIIRASEREYVKNIPIIAMTADAFAEDIIACKEAGMNGHVAKPLDMKKLIKELRTLSTEKENKLI